MVFGEFKDFSEVYIQANRRVCLQANETITSIRSTQGLIEDLVIEVKSFKCDEIDLGLMGYKKEKWSHLIKTYVDKDKLSSFYDDVKSSRGLSIAYDFNRKDSHNGSCLREIILTRPNQNKPFTYAKVIWRATELQRRFAADLILLSKILEGCPGLDLKKITFFIAQAYQSSMYIIPILKPIFGIDFKDLNPKVKFHKLILDRERKYYQPDSPPQKLSCNARMQQLHFDYKNGVTFPKLTSKELELWE